MQLLSPFIWLWLVTFNGHIIHKKSFIPIYQTLHILTFESDTECQRTLAFHRILRKDLVIFLYIIAFNTLCI